VLLALRRGRWGIDEVLAVGKKTFYRRFRELISKLTIEFLRWRKLLGFWAALRLWIHERLAGRAHPRCSQLRRIEMLGYCHPLYFRTHTSDEDVIWLIFGIKEYEAIGNEKDVHLILDCGANIGCTSFYFLHRYPKAHVIVVEPDPGNFRMCERNLAPFAERVTLVNSAVWSKRISLRLERGSFKDGREWSFQVRLVREGETGELLAVTIDELLTRSGKTTIDLLKVDIEGSELHLFGEGAQQWLKRTRTLAIELHGPGCERAFEKTMEGFCFRQSHAGELTVCRDIAPKPAIKSNPAAFSVIICTRNRADRLTKTLDSVAVATGRVPHFLVEVVVVDNGSTDHTSAVIDRWAQARPFPVRQVIETRPGLAAARNAGCRAATGAIVVFTDDDCTLNPDYLDVLSRYFAKDSEPVIRGGRVELGDPDDLPFSILLRDERKQLGKAAHPGGFIIGANMVIPRPVIEKIGLFDERFGAGAVFKAGEETDLIYRAVSAGVPVEYVPDLRVQHFHGRKDRTGLAQLSYGYCVGHGAMYAKHLGDRKLLRHLYWEIKTFVRKTITRQSVTDPVTGLSDATLLRATVHGMLLYAWNTSLDIIHAASERH
jgi:FkbM family methyltransferase